MPPIACAWSPPAPCAMPATAAPSSTGCAPPPAGAPRVISGLEEGRLIHLGILSNARIAKARALLIDLGGGSCELTISLAGHIEEMISLPIGAVRMTQTFLQHDPPKKKELEAMRSLIHREISRIQKRIIAARVQIAIATSGTPAALSGLYAAKVRGYDETKPHTVPHEGVTKIVKELSRRSLAQRRLLPGIRPAARRNHHRRRHGVQRSHGPVQAAQLPLSAARLARRPAGPDDGRLQRQYRHPRAGRVGAARRAARRRQALWRRPGVCRSVFAIWRCNCSAACSPVHQLPPEYADWLEAAAMLHEVGSYINRSGRRRHTYYIVANSEIFGYTPVQRRIIAAIARYLGKSLPAPSDRVIRLLPGQGSERRSQGGGAAEAGARARSGTPRRGARSASPRASGWPGTPDAQAELGRHRSGTVGGGAGTGYFRAVFGRELLAESVEDYALPWAAYTT